MWRQVLATLLIGAFGVALAAGAGAASLEPERVAPAEAADMQAALLETPKFDLSLFLLTRLTVDGRRVEVTSLGPTLVADDLRGAHWAVSLLAYTPDKSALVLFSRDPESGVGYRLTIPVADLTEGMELGFPVLKNGALAGAALKITAQIQVP